jgi:hypothetical protein
VTLDKEEQPQYNNEGSLRLPQFWAENSVAWFGSAKTRLQRTSTLKFDPVVNFLDLVSIPPEDNHYKTIKARLCEHHQLTEFQQVWRSSMPWRLWAAGSRLSSSMI